MKIKNLLILIILLPLFSFNYSLHQKEGKISADLSCYKDQFDHVIIKMVGFEEFGDTITTLDTVIAEEGKFEYRFNVPETRLATFTLFKNGEIVNDIAIKDNNTSPECGYFSEILIGNEDIKMTCSNFQWQGLPFAVAYCDGLKENKWYYMFSPFYGPKYDPVNMESVRDNNTSYAVLQSIYFQKEMFSTQEISDMLDLFSDELKQSNTYEVLIKYRDTMLDLEKDEK
jgi:hypothetical protein